MFYFFFLLFFLSRGAVAKPGRDLVVCTDEECGPGCIQLDGLKGPILKKLVLHCHSWIYEGAKASVEMPLMVPHTYHTNEKVVTMDSA